MFSSASANALGENGLFYGGVGFFFKEIGAATFCATYAFVVSYVMLLLLSMVMEVMVQDAQQLRNLDRLEFSEVAYGGGGGSMAETRALTEALNPNKGGDMEMGQKK